MTSGHDKAAAHINLYHLWLPSQIKPATIAAETGEGPEAHPYQRSYWKLMAAEEESLTLGMGLLGD